MECRTSFAPGVSTSPDVMFRIIGDEAVILSPTSLLLRRKGCAAIWSRSVNFLGKRLLEVSPGEAVGV
jgi:hypothetical protein